MRKLISLILTVVMIMSLLPISTLAQTSGIEQVFYFESDLTTVNINKFSNMTTTTMAGESCTKFQGNTTEQEQFWMAYAGSSLGSSDFVMSYDVYPTDSVKSYRLVTSGHTQLATDILDTMFVRNQWNNITLVVNSATTTNTSGARLSHAWQTLPSSFSGTARHIFC